MLHNIKDNKNGVTRFSSDALFMVFHRVEEDIKQADQIRGPSHVLGVELHAERITNDLITFLIQNSRVSHQSR